MSKYDVELYKEVSKNDRSFVFSPYSIMDCITLAYNGMSENSKALLFKAGVTSELIRSYAALDDSAKKMQSLHIVNKLYVNDSMGSKINTALIRTGALEQVIMNDETRLTINQWISDNTNRKIQNLIPAGVIAEGMAMVMANAIWMQQKWKNKCHPCCIEWAFDRDNYKAFTGSSDNTIAKDQDGVTILRLCYDDETINGIDYADNPKMSMYIVTEDEKKRVSPDEWMASGPDLNKAFDFNAYKGLASYTNVEYSVPCFKTEFKEEVLPIIKKIGLSAVLTREAYRAIGDISVDSIYHGAFIRTDENGTEAAAAAAEVIMYGCVPDFSRIITRTITVDRPFILAIKEEVSKQILFMGRCDRDSLEKYH